MVLDTCRYSIGEKSDLKIISYNVNGINACAKKGLIKFILNENAEIVMLQETKASLDTISEELLHIGDYENYWNPGEHKGHSGVMIYTKIKPLSIQMGMETTEFDNEGRLITAEFADFYVINAYVVNAGRGLPRLTDKQKFMGLFGDYCEKLRKSKPIIVGGDLNVAHKEIDLKNPKTNTKNAGFTPEERDAFTKFLGFGYIDTFREFVKEGGHYTWWSMRSADAREKNIGWRLDYFVISAELRPRLVSSDILKEMDAADHCPIRLILK